VTAAGGSITVLVGAAMLRLTLAGTYQRYVRAGMGPWLVVAGVVVIVLGVTTLVRALRRPGAPDPHGHGHGDGDRHDGGGHGHGDGHDGDVDGGHGHGRHDPRVGWLLLAPVAALLLVAPPALGSYGVDRSATLDIRAGAPAFDRLEPGGEPVPLSLLEFSQRAFDRDGASFDGATLQLIGFAPDDPHDPDGGRRAGSFRLARYQIGCCAADAAPVVVRIVGVPGGPPSRDRWVIVTGTFHPSDTDVPELTAVNVVEMAPPDDPYE
jgi:uncharacterized repeat protein (TIGR03943 family)